MKIRFKKDYEGELVTSFNEQDDFAETENEYWKSGDIEEVDVIEDRDESMDVQFGDGSMLFGLGKNDIEVIE